MGRERAVARVASPKSLPRFGGVCSSCMNEQQEIPFESMIKMVAYEPRERATMAEVVE